MQNLVSLVGEITNAADSIKTLTGEISDGNQDLSQRTEEQSNCLDETTSAIRELTSAGKQNSDNARQANQIADAASSAAEAGGTVVARAIASMAEINNSSSQRAEGSRLVDESGATLTAIVDSVTQERDSSSEIATASERQTTSV